MYIDRFRASGFKCFESLELDLVNPETHPDARLPNITVALGINGVGKSTLLQGIALGLMGEEIRDSGWVPRHQVRKSSVQDGDETSQVAVTLRLSPEDRVARETAPMVRSTSFRGGRSRDRFMGFKGRPEISKILSSEKHPGLFLAAYGSTRQAGDPSRFDPSLRHQEHTVRYRRLGSLFEARNRFDLVPLASWLPQGPRREEILGIITHLLPDDYRMTQRIEDGDLVVVDRDLKIPLSALSDGYQSFLGWLGDLLYHLERNVEPGTRLTEFPGVVLVDEIDLHLHPEWQQSVIPKLSKTFERMQFVLTTHSPLIVGTVDACNVRVLHRDEGAAVVSEPEEETFGLSSDQVLLSPYFGLSSVRAEAFRKKLDEAREAAESGDIEASILYTRLLTLGAAGEEKSN